MIGIFRKYTQIKNKHSLLYTEIDSFSVKSFEPLQIMFLNYDEMIILRLNIKLL